MKNNFKNWDKEKHRKVSSKGGKVKSKNKSNAARLRFRKRVIEHVQGRRNDLMIEHVTDIIKFYRKDKKNWAIRC